MVTHKVLAHWKCMQEDVHKTKEQKGSFTVREWVHVAIRQGANRSWHGKHVGVLPVIRTTL
jgi:hypothetical protein